MSENTTNDASNRVAPNPSPAALDMMVRIIMSQTEMTHEDVISALERTQYDLKRVIREYMTSGSTATATATATATGAASASTNQLRFSEIRNFMDKSAETFRRNQEMTRIYQGVQEKKKQQQADATATAAAAASKL